MNLGRKGRSHGLCGCHNSRVFFFGSFFLLRMTKKMNKLIDAPKSIIELKMFRIRCQMC